MKNPGIGVMTLEQILGCPEEILEFHLWYFREKGWVAREETGLLAITAAGVDKIEEQDKNWADHQRLITHTRASDPKKKPSGPTTIKSNGGAKTIKTNGGAKTIGAKHPR